MLLAYFAGGTDKGGDPMSVTFLFIWLAVVTLVTVLDYVIPAWFTKMTGGHKAASWGTILGFICGTGMKLICSGVMLYYIVVYL